MNVETIINELDPDLVKCVDCGHWMSLSEMLRKYNRCPNCDKHYLCTYPLTWKEKTYTKQKNGMQEVTIELMSIRPHN